MPVGVGVTGTADGSSDPAGANVFFDSCSVCSQVQGNWHDFGVWDSYMGKWIKLRFVIDTE